MGSYLSMVNDFGEGIATFVAMPKTRQIAQPKNFKYKEKLSNSDHLSKKWNKINS